MTDHSQSTTTTRPDQSAAVDTTARPSRGERVDLGLGDVRVVDFKPNWQQHVDPYSPAYADWAARQRRRHHPQEPQE